MKPELFTQSKWGRLVKPPEGYWAFVPHPLPPAINPTWQLADQLAVAERELAHLSGLAHNLPNPQLLIGPFLRREAVLSSRIEGTQASLSDLFYFEAAGEPKANTSDVQEVANYVHALEYGLRRLNTLPISVRLMGELHERLMAGVRGGHLTPGELRRSQNWIGPPGCTLNDASYVPPPVHEMKEALSDLEKFIHAPPALPALVRLAFIHYQFEAIHPYLDGNGRIGRLLITLVLCAEKLLPQPMLYLSAYFEKNRAKYYQLLLSVSQEGRWDDWLAFFLQGVADQSRDAIHRTKKLLALQQQYKKKLLAARASTLPIRLLEELFKQPVTSAAHTARVLKVTHRSAALNIEKLVKAGILTETEGPQRGRWFIAKKIVQISASEDITETH